MEEKVQYQSEERIRDIHDQLAGTYIIYILYVTLNQLAGTGGQKKSL